MQRRGVAIVEFLQSPDCTRPTSIKFVWKPARLRFNLGNQALKKKADVESVGSPSVQGQSAGSQIHGSGDRGSHNDGRRRRRFAQILERYIPAQAESHQRDAPVAFRRMTDHGREIAGLAAMVESGQTIRLLTAAAEIPGQGIPTGAVQGLGHSAHVIGGAAAFQPVSQNRHSLTAAPDPIQIEEVSVLKFQAFTLEQNAGTPPDQRGQDRLDVRVAEKVRWMKSGLEDWHGRISILDWLSLPGQVSCEARSRLLETHSRQSALGVLLKTPAALPFMLSSPPSSPNDIPRNERWFAVIAFGLALALRVLYAWHYRIDSDEPQHLHVVWEWTQGRLPYRDFFDNHTPMFQAFCAPLFRLLGIRADILAPMRLAMIPLFALTIACVWKITSAFLSRRIALWTAVLAALYPPFFLSSVEFRPDELWALLWLAELAILTGRPLSPRRMFFAGVILGFSFCVSMKTSLFVAALALAFGGTIWMRHLLRGESRPLSEDARNGAAFLGGALVLPALVAAFFIAQGAGKQMAYCVIQHNIIPEHHGWGARVRPVLRWLRWFPLIGIGGVIIGFRPVSRDTRLRQAFIFFAAAFYYITLVSFWPVLTDEDYLPSHPALLISAAPAALWLSGLASKTVGFAEPILPALLAVIELGIIGFTASPFVDETVSKTGMIANVLRMTHPGDYVMDSKGEAIYRERPYYYVLERMTNFRIKNGSIIDIIPERLIATRAPLTTSTSIRMPKTGKEFIKANYVPIAFRLLTLGKVICDRSSNRSSVEFEVVIPARYTLQSASGRAEGLLDGTPFDAPRDLAAGHHEFSPARAQGRIVLVWAQAVEQGYSPFDSIPPDAKTEQD